MSKKGNNIYKRKDGRWEGRYIKGYTQSGKALYGYVYAKNYHDARQKQLYAITTLTKSTPISKQEKKCFKDYCEEWLVLNRNRVKQSTYVKYHNIIYNHIIAQIGTYSLETLDAVIIEKFSHTLLTSGSKKSGQGLSAKTVKDILVVLHAILKYARKQLGSTLEEIELVYPKEKKKEMRVLSKEEQTKFIEYLLQDLDDCKFGVLLALLTGMRIGEICALRWKNISLQDQIVRVEDTMQRLQILDKQSTKKTEVLIGEPKSVTSNRIIPLTQKTTELCQTMQATCKEAFVLTGRADRFIEPRTLQYRLNKYTAACGLSDVNFHALRHTFATRCVEVDFEIKSLSEILGHSSVQITLDRYVHSSIQLKKKNMEKLSAIGF